MRLLFTTDLHGSKDKYNRVFDIARRDSVQAVLNGGDMFPHGHDPFAGQKSFMVDFLDRHFDEYDRCGIEYLCMTGNDDLAAYDTLLDSIIARHPRVKNIAQNRVSLGGYEFIGMNRVSDYPFRLKDRCRMDTLGFIFPHQFGTGLLSQESGKYRELPDWKSYARELPTIEDELELLPHPSDYRKAVYAIHMPPASIGLDVCADHRKVGSQAVYDFLRARQPLLALHGHIHESPDVSGVWKEKIGSTICIQPGQRDGLTYVIIDLEMMRCERMSAK